MSKINDGGPVYPSPVIADPETGQILGPKHPGMTLRQWYVGMAMQGLLANQFPYNNIAEKAISYADDVLAALEEGE